jgi:hypothetical protein
MSLQHQTKRHPPSVRKFSFDCDLAEYWLCCNLCSMSLEIGPVMYVGRATELFISDLFISELRPPLVASFALGEWAVTSQVRRIVPALISN